jgi:quercetin dioxygenase-like cupin family protein
MNAARLVRLAPVFCLAASLVGSAPPETTLAPAHKMQHAADLAWGEGPPALPPGVKVAVLSGDPGQPGPFTLRAKMPAGYRVPPHWHPTEENVTVLSGTLAMGAGDALGDAALHELKAGDFANMPANVRHVAVARVETVIQVHGVGPFAVTYVNAAEDPRNAAPKK